MHGAGITVAQGLKRAQPDTAHIAFVGDSTFFHTGLPGIANAVYNQTDITVVILDNYTTAMTGHQPHPGIGKTMMGIQHGKIDIYGVVKALGAAYVKKADPFDLENAVKTVQEAVAEPGRQRCDFRVAVYCNCEAAAHDACRRAEVQGVRTVCA